MVLGHHRHQRDGWLVPPPLDVDGYLATVERCRDRFPNLRILSGTELGEPHWHPGPVRAALAFGSDAHQPASVAREFARAAGLAEAAGFRPGRHPHDLWRRAGMIGGWT